MWKAQDLLMRNVTRSLPPRSDTGVRGSSGGGASGVGSSSAKIASKTSAAWVPESIINMKKIFSRQIFHRGQHQRRHGVRYTTFEMTAIHHYLHGFPTTKPSQLRSGNSFDNV